MRMLARLKDSRSCILPQILKDEKAQVPLRHADQFRF